jgi:hypothetical protein
LIRWNISLRASQWRHISPTPTFRFRFTQGQHPPGAGTVDRDRLFHEHIQPLGNRIGEVHPAKGRWGGQDDDVARLQDVHRLLVTVEADELAILGHIDLLVEPRLELVVARLDALLEDVGHGDQLGRAVLAVHRVARSPGPPATRPDQGDLERVVFSGVRPGQHQPANRASDGRGTGALEQIAAGDGGGLGIDHRNRSWWESRGREKPQDAALLAV